MLCRLNQNKKSAFRCGLCVYEGSEHIIFYFFTFVAHMKNQRKHFLCLFTSLIGSFFSYHIKWGKGSFKIIILVNHYVTGRKSQLFHSMKNYNSLFGSLASVHVAFVVVSIDHELMHDRHSQPQKCRIKQRLSK